MLNYDIGNFQAKFTGESRLQQQRKEYKKCELQIHAQRNIMHETFILQQFFFWKKLINFLTFSLKRNEKMRLCWIDKD